MNIGGAWEDTRRRLLRRILQSPHTQQKNLSSGRFEKFSRHFYFYFLIMYFLCKASIESTRNRWRGGKICCQADLTNFLDVSFSTNQSVTYVVSLFLRTDLLFLDSDKNSFKLPFIFSGREIQREKVFQLWPSFSSLIDSHREWQRWLTMPSIESTLHKSPLGPQSSLVSLLSSI